MPPGFHNLRLRTMQKQNLTLDRPRHWLVAGVVGAAVVVAAWAWWAMRPEVEAGRPAEDRGGSGSMANPFGTVKNGAGQAQPDAVPAWMATASGGAAGGSTLLPELTSEEWAALREATQGQPNGQAELARLVEYARFQKGFERWQTLREQAKTEDQRRDLARELLQAVPRHLAQQEMMAGEALLVQTALLEDAEPDPTRRLALQQQARTQIEGMLKDQSDANSVDAARRTQQVQELQRRQAEIVRKCQAQAGACDQKKLEDDLQAARVAVFGS